MSIFKYYTARKVSLLPISGSTEEHQNVGTGTYVIVLPIQCFQKNMFGRLYQRLHVDYKPNE